MAEDLLAALNPAQRDAAACIQGPVMIIAGAGSGKTRTLTYRIAYLLQQGVNPFNILALTFTNKAAREMKDRIETLIGPQAKNVSMGTFHSIFARLLRSDGERLGYPKDFTIYDTDDCKSVIRQLIKSRDLDPKTYVPSQVLNRISEAKSNLYGPQEYLHRPEFFAQDSAGKKPLIGELYTLYADRLKRSSAMDFDDLLFNMNLLLRDNADVLEKYQNRFRYILVDEYQDTNHAQYLIIKKLAAAHKNICVVGDDAQSIYAFRGANIQNIFNFRIDYPGFKTYKLEQNYRSTKTIVNSANSIISNNRDQIEKTIWTSNDQGEPISLHRSESDQNEGRWVAQSIFETRNNDRALHTDFAILYRTNSQSRAIEDALRQFNIPYRIHGGHSFYQRKEIKDVVAYLRAVVNPNDEEALLRIINYPARGIGSTTIDRLRALADTHQQPIWNIIRGLDQLQHGIQSGIAQKISQFADLIQGFHAKIAQSDAFELANEIWMASGIKYVLAEDDPLEAETRLRNIEELLNAIKDFTLTMRQEVDEKTGEMNEVDGDRTLDEFAVDIALLTDADQSDDQSDKVTLMTIHAAKGLEYPYVFVVGMEENLFPGNQALQTQAQLEEERRLFYVAVTRAEKRLFLSFAQSRFIWGQMTFCEPSRFLSEIDAEFIDHPESLKVPQWNYSPATSTSAFKPRFVSNERYIQPKSPEPNSPSRPLSPARKPEEGRTSLARIPSQKLAVDPSLYQTGDRVRHAKFGEGAIERIEDGGQKLIVAFEQAGTKTLVTAFAKLEILPPKQS